MPEPATVWTGFRVPVDLMEQATERARETNPGTKITVSGVIRLALAQLAGLPAERAREHLKVRPSGGLVGRKH